MTTCTYVCGGARRGTFIIFFINVIFCRKTLKVAGAILVRGRPNLLYKKLIPDRFITKCLIMEKRIDLGMLLIGLSPSGILGRFVMKIRTHNKLGQGEVIAARLEFL